MKKNPFIGLKWMIALSRLRKQQNDNVWPTIQQKLLAGMFASLFVGRFQ
jgi:hypothetical protein